MKRVFFVVVLCILIFSTTSPAQAATPLVTCGLRSMDNPETQVIEGMCTECGLLKTFKNIIDFVTFILTPAIATLLILFSGFMLVLGGASPETITTGKKMFSNTIIGVVIVYGSFMVANFFIQSLTVGDDLATSWFKLECANNIGVPPPDDRRDPTEGNPGGTERTPIGSVTPGGFKNSMSPELVDFRRCLESRLTAGDFSITSTTDNNIDDGTCDPLADGEIFGSRSNCQHRQGSQHYGGTSAACQAKGSYALDYIGRLDLIERAAKSCNPQVFALKEDVGNNNEHIHLSIGGLYGCGGN